MFVGPGVWHHPQIQPPQCCCHPEIHLEQQSLLPVLELQLQVHINIQYFLVLTNESVQISIVSSEQL